MAEPVPESISFPDEEEKVMKLWKDLNAFQTCLKQSKSRPKYTFFDGPPFATGLPHYGHILAGTVKDVVTRWAHQSGFHVERRFGWDCHGLPVVSILISDFGSNGMPNPGYRSMKLTRNSTSVDLRMWLKWGSPLITRNAAKSSCVTLTNGRSVN